MSQTSYSADALMQFLDRVGSKGWVPKGTIAVMKSNSKRVLWSLDKSEREDVRQIDIETAIRRFANLNPEVSPQSLRDYRGRLEKSISMFSRYTDDPVNFKVSAPRSDSQSNPPSSEKVKPRKRTRDAETSSGGRASAVASPPTPATNTASVASPGMSYHFPLRPDLTVMFSNLPRDLRQNEVRRIAAFLNSLTEDFES